MIVVELMGGLGNQLFQYAFGLWLSDKRQESVVWNVAYYDNRLVYCLKFFKNWLSGKLKIFIQNYRSFELLKFNLSTINLIKKTAGKTDIYIDKGSPDQLVADVLNRKNNHFKGYWQYYQICAEIRGKLLAEFSLKKAYLPDRRIVDRVKLAKNSVAVHFRRGDYFSKNGGATSWSADLGDYYNQAIAFCEKKLQRPYFFVFSDDVGWSKKNWRWGDNVFFVSDSHLKDYQEIYLMSLCQHQIIANSTFSWWGAWLNENKDKMVIAPKTWFADGSMAPQGLIPDSWLQL